MHKHKLILILFSILAVSGQAVAVEVRGTVTGLLDDSIIVTIPAGQGASSGDAVEIVFETGGLELFAGAGEVTSIDGTQVTVRLREGQGKVTLTMQAIIEHTGTSLPAGMLSDDREAEPSKQDKGDKAGDVVKKAAAPTAASQELFERGDKEFSQKNYAVAAPILLQAAELGHAEAMGYVAYIYYEGLSVPESKESAFNWYRMGALGGDSYSMRQLGWFYQNGWGTPVDAYEASRWYHEAAAAGVPRAYNDLGVFYREGRAGLAPDENEAMKWFGKAAEAGIAAAMYNLARGYQEGLGGTAVNKELAIFWYRKASEQGYVRAIQRLGEMGVK